MTTYPSREHLFAAAHHRNLHGTPCHIEGPLTDPVLVAGGRVIGTVAVAA